MKTPALSRPKTARAVAGRARTPAEFGRNLRDWFHELRLLTSGAELARACRVRPPQRAGLFRDGGVADAFLAAQVEHLCTGAGLRAPRWVYAPGYVLRQPWFPHENANAHLRAVLIRDAHAAFVNHNLFTTSEITWRPRVGRPRVRTAAQHREAGRLRQQRWRERRRTSSG